MQFHYRPQGMFHVVVEGQCYLRESGSEDLSLLKAGDIVAFPTGGVHWISDSPGGQSLVAENVVKVSGDEGLLLLKSGEVMAFPTGGNPWGSNPQLDQILSPNRLEAELHSGDSPMNGEITTLLNGTLSYDTSIDHPFLKQLPCIIHISTHQSGDLHGLESLLKLLVIESTETSPGTPLMVDRLIEILFVQLLRAHMREMKHSNGYIAALSDPKIGVALNLMHTETDQHWTVETLCKAAAMGRTSFTQKFVDMVGSTPKSYLTSTRLMKAKARLQHSNDSMLSIAESAGYASEAAFGKAIKKHSNRTPGELRKELSDSEK
jgi:AraC-like DNA-binding protein